MRTNQCVFIASLLNFFFFLYAWISAEILDLSYQLAFVSPQTFKYLNY